MTTKCRDGEGVELHCRQTKSGLSMTARIVREALVFSAFLLAVAGCSTKEENQTQAESNTDLRAPEPMASSVEPSKATVSSTTVQFMGPAGAEVDWDLAAPTESELSPAGTPVQILPSRYDFTTPEVLRLKIAKIPNHEEMELYPTLEVVPRTPGVEAYLVNHTVPVEITDDDIAHLAKRVVVCKVVYLPDQDPQEPSEAKCETLASWTLAAGADPVIEADRRGTVILILRIGPDEVLQNQPHSGQVPRGDTNCVAR